ncbi:LptF/LptG family permease [Amaricoccus macauensis]|uniref:LptF/LptG family permease n=1 Tax=Amaricoccus macauensis TaxID=57001 RepID=UPI003C7DDFAA
MKRLDRYLLRQLFGAFGFFLLIFTGVIWLTQSVQLIETVISSGQSAWIFLEFSSLVLPQVFVIVLPLSAIGAALYALNKLYSGSELVVMMAAGYGPVQLLRAILIFGTIIAAAMAVVMMVLVPISGRELADRTRAIRSDLAASLIVERQFIHPLNGLTLFIDETGRSGEMEGIFLNDQRDPEQVITYSAERALFLRQEDEARLVMQDGVALTTTEHGELNNVAFDQFVFDLSDLIDDNGSRTRRPSEYSVIALLDPTPEMLDTRFDLGDYIAEGHYKISMPLLAMSYPAIALVTFLAGGYRRSGFGRRVIVAVGVGALLQAVCFACQSQVETHPGQWPVMYAPQGLAIVYTLIMLRYLSHPWGGRKGVQS